jgi:hypothetical protein
VTQDELLEALWPETYVNPEGIRKYILEIRKVLGDRSSQPAFIETFPKRGYQFVARNGHRRPPFASADPPPVSWWAQEGLARLNGYSNRIGGQRQVVFVTGEAGIGKTFRVTAATASPGAGLRSREAMHWFGGIETYYPMLEAILLLQAQQRFMIQTIAPERPPG